MPLRRRTVAVAFLALLPVAPAAGQELLGTLRSADGTTPAGGVVLVATRAADRVVVGRTVTGDQGVFRLPLPPVEVELRALRIGYRPTLFGRYAVGPGERRRVELRLTDDPIALPTVVSRADGRCAIGDRTGETVATLFEEARKALIASQLTPPEGRPSARVLLEESIQEPDGRIRMRPVRSVRDGLAARPFRSAPPAQLAALGYSVEERDGTIYYAPDANVLLSEQFAATHCLRLAAADAEHPERVGLAFEPVGAPRDRVRIRGHFWLDRATLALQRLEFEYVGLPGGLTGPRFGGSIDFVQLPGGLWIEDRWEIRMPQLATGMQASIVAGGSSTSTTRLEAVYVTGGRVLSVGSDERMLYRAAEAEAVLAATDLVEPETASLWIRAGCANAPVDAEPLSGLFGLVRRPDRAPLADATVVASWQDTFRIGLDGGITWRNREAAISSQSDGFYALCTLPRDRRIVVQARLGERRTPRLLVRFAEDADRLRADFTLEPDR